MNTSPFPAPARHAAKQQSLAQSRTARRRIWLLGFVTVGAVAGGVALSGGGQDAVAHSPENLEPGYFAAVDTGDVGATAPQAAPYALAMLSDPGAASSPEPVPADPARVACQEAARVLERFGNGRAPFEYLQELSWAPGHFLRPDAADALEALNEVHLRERGTSLTLTSTWRSYESQHHARQVHGHFAADPGTSNHGWGIAVDLGGGIQWSDNEAHAWMQANGPAFGWHLPAWAQPTGGLPEAWHWEFHGTSAIAVDSAGPVEVTPTMSAANC